MFQAIQTRYLRATNCRPSRVKASVAGGSKVYLWDYDLNGEGNHVAAASAFADSLGWFKGTPEQPTRDTGEIVSGCLPNGDYCHVLRSIG